MNALLAVFSVLKAYRGKTLANWFSDLLTKSDADLDREGSNFFKILATWVYRNFDDRRKKGVPMGELGKFVYPDSREIDFTRAVMIYVVRTLRKRGLLETDLARKNQTFELLVKAYELTPAKEKSE